MDTPLERFYDVTCSNLRLHLVLLMEAFIIEKCFVTRAGERRENGPLGLIVPFAVGEEPHI